jgi:hypothetical protein
MARDPSTFPDPPSSSLLRAFDRTISAPRWGTYLVASGFRTDVAHALYLWNASAGESFLFPLQATEVALRNVVSDALTATFGSRWWLDAGGRRCLGDERCDDVDRARARIRNKYRTEPDAGRIVASLMFGFWSAMLRRQYDGAIWDARTMEAFPNLTDGRTIRNVSDTAGAILTLRNRIFHHEPLIGRDLSRDYGEILRLLGWICPLTRAWVARNATVPTVLRQRPR